MDFLIQNGKIFDPLSRSIKFKNIAIEDGKNSKTRKQ